MDVSKCPDCSRQLGQKTGEGISCAAKKGRAGREVAGYLKAKHSSEKPLGEAELPERLGEGTGRAPQEGRGMSKRRDEVVCRAVGELTLPGLPQFSREFY